jgi:hypothetical protein
MILIIKYVCGSAADLCALHGCIGEKKLYRLVWGSSYIHTGKTGSILGVVKGCQRYIDSCRATDLLATEIDDNGVPIKTDKPTTAPNQQGCSCVGCGNYFPYAVANQADGTLKCWSCRTYPYFGSKRC